MGKDYVQRINDTTIYTEKMYYRNFTDPRKKFVLSLHYDGNNSYLYVNGNQELKFKAKTDQVNKIPCCNYQKKKYTNLFLRQIHLLF